MFRTSLTALLVAGLLTQFATAQSTEGTPTTEPLPPAELTPTDLTDPAPNLDDDPEVLPPDKLCYPRTIAIGEISQFGYGSEVFAGATLIIRDPDTWKSFWARHAGENGARPPRVNFRRHVVVAAIMGLQTSGGGPGIYITSVHTTRSAARVHIVEDPRPGLLDVITNPFHIVAVPRGCLPAGLSTVFLKTDVRRDSGIVSGTVYGNIPWRDAPIPLVNARVTLRPTGSADDGTVAPARETFTDARGRYFFVNVRPLRSYWLSAERRGFEPDAEIIGVPPQTHVAQDFVLNPVERPDDEDDPSTNGRPGSGEEVSPPPGP